MGINNPYKTYENNSVNTASPGELTLMLYNGCLKFIGNAKKGIANNNFEFKNISIQKSQKIIHELMITLNMDYEVSENMKSLYEYMDKRLIDANVQNDITILEEVESLVGEFRDTWKQVIQLNRQKQHQGGMV